MNNNNRYDTEEVLKILNHFLSPEFGDTASQKHQNKRLTPVAERGDIAMLYTLLAAYGHVDALESVYELCGDIRVDYELVKSDNKFDPDSVNKVNGLAFYLMPVPLPVLGAIKNLDELARLLELIPKMGLGFLTGIDSQHSLLWDESAQIIKNTHLFSPGFEGELPVLDIENKVINQPELMLALDARAKNSHYAQAFKTMLCWVPLKEVENNPGRWCAYLSAQDIRYTSSNNEGRWIEKTIAMKDMSPDDRHQIFDTNRCLYKGFSLKTVRDVETAEPIDDALLQAMGSAEINCGFGFKKGYALCRVNTNHLTEFTVAEPDEGALNEAVDFVAGYQPIAVIAALYDTKPEAKTFDGMCTIGIDADIDKGESISNSVNRILGHIGAEDCLGKSIQSEIPSEVLRAMVTRQPTKVFGVRQPVLDLNGILVASTKLGIETTYLNGALFNDEIETLLQSDIKLSENGSIDMPGLMMKSGNILSVYRLKILKPNINEKDVLPLLFEKGARVINGHDFRDVRKSMSAIGRTKANLSDDHIDAHKARVTLEGIEKCSKLARSEPQWNSLDIVFGREAVRPFLNQASGKQKGKALSEDLGL